jgi:hypothetical protein
MINDKRQMPQKLCLNADDIEVQGVLEVWICASSPYLRSLSFCVFCDELITAAARSGIIIS